MKRNMKVSGSILLLGIVILIAVPVVNAVLPPAQEGGMAASMLIPVGYFLALVGAAAAAVCWMFNRRI